MIDYNMYGKPLAVPTFILVGKYTDMEVLDNLKEDILKLSNENNPLNYKTNVKGKFTGWESLIENKWFIKFMNRILDYANVLYNKQIKFRVRSAWGNVYENETDHVTFHRHLPADCFSGIIYFDDHGPGTMFPEYDLNIKEEKGKFVFFHPQILHGVEKFNYQKQRITCAFNTDFEREWN